MNSKSEFGEFLTCQTLREMNSKGQFGEFLTCQTLRKMNSKSEFGEFLTCQALRKMDSKRDFGDFLTCQTLRKMNSKRDFGDFRMETRCSLFLFPGIYYLFGRVFVLAARLATTLSLSCFCFQIMMIIYSEMADSGPGKWN